MKSLVKITSITPITPDVVQIITTKPAEVTFAPGQAADLAINEPGWEDMLRPFTFTSLQDDDFLEFTIKTYPDHHGVTAHLLTLAAGDELFLHDPFGDISYRGEGIFIAGGAGITPFIAIFKQLKRTHKIGNNKLIFGNKTRADIIHETEFTRLLGDNFINVLSAEDYEGYLHGHIDSSIIAAQINNQDGYFYVCGPEAMMKSVDEQLKSLNINEDRIIKEAY